MERGNYRCLKLTEQVMKILERIVDGFIRRLVAIDDSQFGFVPGRDTTDAIFVVMQLQEKYLVANKRLYMAFVDLEKLASVAQLDAPSDWRPGGRGFNPAKVGNILSWRLIMKYFLWSFSPFR